MDCFGQDYEHQSLENTFGNLNFGRSGESGIYGTAANVMNPQISQENSFNLPSNMDSFGAHFGQAVAGHMSGTFTHRSSASSYWEPPATNDQRMSSFESPPGRLSVPNPDSSSNNTVIMDTSLNAKSSAFNTTMDSDADTSSDALKLDLQLKETQIESLEQEIKKLKGIFNQGLTFKQQEEQKLAKTKTLTYDSEIEMPANLEVIFCKLSESLKKKDYELEETKRRLEAIITAVSLNPSNTTTRFGRYDEEGLAHKMITRLEALLKENEEMAKMLSYGRVKEVTIEMGLLRKENQELKQKIKTLELERTNRPVSPS